MFFDYLRLLGTGAQPEFSSNYIFPTAFILLSIIGIVFIGYKIKEELGAIVGLLFCVFIILYLNDMLSFFF
jgi:energy-converting hydrogenase Eha subunit A